MKKIDVVMPVAPKDASKAQHALRGILQNSLNPIRNIYIITPQKFSLEGFNEGSLHWILDAQFPFSINDIRHMFQQKNSTYDNASWYYQQLLKFYAFEVIEGALDDILIFDSDFMLTKKIKFLSDTGKAILAFGYPFKWLLGTSQYPEQVEHVHAKFATKLIPGWFPQHAFSGMQHHMVWQRSIMDDIFAMVKQQWGQPFWKAFIDQIDMTKWNAAAEYVIYHHFALWRHPHKVLLRHLNACDIVFDAQERAPAWNIIENLGKQRDHNAIGFHGFLKLNERLATMDYIPHSLKQDMLNANQLMFKLTLQEGILNIENL